MILYLDTLIKLVSHSSSDSRERSKSSQGELLARSCSSARSSHLKRLENVEYCEMQIIKLHYNKYESECIRCITLVNFYLKVFLYQTLVTLSARM